jgi:predicted DNA-binding transcriptional regulator AlpA
MFKLNQEAAMETMNLEDVCNVLKITKATARNRLSQGLPMPPSFKVGRNRLFLKTEFYQWIAQQAKPKDAPSQH